MAPNERPMVVITGASRGIGRGCARAFGIQGAEVVLVARKLDELQRVVDEIVSEGGRASAVACDVTNAEAVRDLFVDLGRCDVLINNAGMNRPQPFLEVDLATLDDLMRLNVRSMFVAAQAAARLMALQRSGVIINMSSQMGHVGAPNRSVYCTTKHAVEGMTKAMAVELGCHGIRVNAICPTFILTPMTAPFFDNQAFRSAALEKIKLGRLGKLEDIMGAVVFLASDASALMTGSALMLDGGWTAE